MSSRLFLLSKIPAIGRALTADGPTDSSTRQRRKYRRFAHCPQASI